MQTALIATVVAGLAIPTTSVPIQADLQPPNPAAPLTEGMTYEESLQEYDRRVAQDEARFAREVAETDRLLAKRDSSYRNFFMVVGTLFVATVLLAVLFSRTALRRHRVILQLVEREVAQIDRIAKLLESIESKLGK